MNQLLAGTLAYEHCLDFVDDDSIKESVVVCDPTNDGISLIVWFKGVRGHSLQDWAS